MAEVQEASIGGRLEAGLTHAMAPEEKGLQLQRLKHENQKHPEDERYFSPIKLLGIDNHIGLGSVVSHPEMSRLSA